MGSYAVLEEARHPTAPDGLVARDNEGAELAKLLAIGANRLAAMVVRGRAATDMSALLRAAAETAGGLGLTVLDRHNQEVLTFVHRRADQDRMVCRNCSGLGHAEHAIIHH